MKTIIYVASILLSCYTTTAQNYNNDNFKIKNVAIKHKKDIGITTWEIKVKGEAGNTVPTKNGKLDGAPVLGYVFPTSLQPKDVGFSQTKGIVALAITSHPDFDDTPLWDENNDSNYKNDGIIWHPHWVILQKDSRVKGGFSVKQIDPKDTNVTLPNTNPGMPMYMDSPGFAVTTTKHKITVVVPDYRINYNTNFTYDGVTAFMKVNTSNKDLPMLSVYEVFDVASKKLTLPYKVKQ